MATGHLALVARAGTGQRLMAEIVNLDVRRRKGAAASMTPL
jgi:hypothetical protein